MKYRVLALCFVLLTVCSSNLFAQSRNYPDTDYGSLIFSPFFGGHFFEKDQSYPQNIPSNDLKDKYSLGLRLGIQAHRHLDIETTLKYVPTNNNIGRVNIFFYHLDGIFNILRVGRIVPFINFGLGGATLQPATLSSETKFLIDYGVGVKFFILKNFAFRFDARGYTYFNETFTNLNVDVGFVYYAKLFGENRDSDGDGYSNRYDLCPAIPENFNGYIDEDGCPDAVKTTPTDGYCEKGQK